MNKSNTLSKQAKWMRFGMQAYLFPGYYRFRRKVVELSGIKHSSVMLDFGCGVGLLEEYLIKHVKLSNEQIIGVDTGKELIEIAKANFPHYNNFNFKVIDDSGNLPFADNKFDIIVSNFVFHLLNNEQKIKVLNEFRRVLKPEGHLLLAEIGKPDNIFGHWIKFLTLKLWIRIWPYEVNSVDSFHGLLPGYIHSAGFQRVNTVCRMKGYIDFIFVTKE